MSNAHKIAVIGMAGRFPGARDVSEFVANLRAGVHSVRRISREELLAVGHEAAVIDDRRYVPARGTLDDPDLFDADFFGITAADATAMDPQHRLFFMAAWHALENAGYAAPEMRRQTGVFGSCSPLSYNHPFSAARTSSELQRLIATTGDHLSTRLSFKLNLQGPSLTVQTACSSSLVAVMTAAQALLLHQCDLALAGGSSVQVPLEGHMFEEGAIFSPDGVCRAFDADAAGTVIGEGVGVVVLKRLDDAVSDRDTIRAVICGYGMNNDGGDKVGYSAPSVSGQANAIATALATADLDPTDLGYVEAHGTGTALGDPVEVAALREVFDSGTDERRYCGLGSLKSNIGHLNAAAGVAGLMKTVASVEEGVLFPSLHVEKPNPAIGFEDSSFFIPTTTTPWPGPSPRRAGVSSFGVGGTNVHLIVEQAPDLQSRQKRGDRESWPVLVSARNRESLAAQCAQLAVEFEAGLDFADAAFSLAVGREAFEHRFACTAPDSGVAARVLVCAESEEPRPVRESVFDFQSGPAPAPAAVAGFARRFPAFRVAWQACEAASAAGGSPLFSPDGSWAEDAAAACAFQYATARLWTAHGIEPTRIVSSGRGAHAAAAFAGEIELIDALTRARGTVTEGCETAREPQADLWVPLWRPGLIGLHGRWIATDEAGDEPADALVGALAAAWAAGAGIRWEPLFAEADCGRIPLPGYAFHTRSYWSHEHPGSASTQTAAITGPGVGARSGLSPEQVGDIVGSAWTKVFGRAPQHPGEDFYEVGGDSLAALELVDTLNTSLSLELQPEDVFEATALDAFTERVLAECRTRTQTQEER